MTSSEPETDPTGPLHRAQEAIDEARAGEKEAMGDLSPGPEVDEPYTGDGVEPEDGVTRGF